MQFKRIVFLTTGSRVSSDRCRGEDIARRMGMPCDIDPSEINSADVVIMIKHVRAMAVNRAGRAIADIVDGARGDTYAWIRKAPRKIEVMTMTPDAARYVGEEFFPHNRCIWMPHTHVNDERRVREPGREIKTLGYNGVDRGFPRAEWEEFAKLAIKAGFSLSRAHHAAKRNGDPRKACADWYYGIDIQVAFRRQYDDPELPLCMKGPTKLNNAGSFGIPSVALPEMAFERNYGMPGNYSQAHSPTDMVDVCKALRDHPALYAERAAAARRAAVPYHIDNVVKRYEELMR